MIPTLRISFEPLGVPYWRDPSDARSSSFVDLRVHPELIDAIPELRGWPALRELVRSLNDTAMPFKSIGCVHAPSAWPGERGGVQYAGYVGLCFEPIERNIQPWEHYALFHQLSEVALERGNDAKQALQVELRATGFYDQDVNGWSLECWFQGLGNTPDEAQAEAEKVLAIIADGVRTKNAW